MVTIQQIEHDLQTAVKARDQVAADTLRGLKTRLQNERIAQGDDLTDEQITAVFRSELKRRNEAAVAFERGDRPEAAAKEREEARLLQRYLPAAVSEEQISGKIDELQAANAWTAKDFGAAMGELKRAFGASADGAVLARILKEKLH